MTSDPSDPLRHGSDDDEACTHPPASIDALLALAFLGTRTQGFNHDLASKIQGLMMAVDELTELVIDNPDAELARVAESMTGAVGELNDVLTANRALTRPTIRGPLRLADLVQRAAERVGVRPGGPLFARDAEGAVIEGHLAGLTHALALAFDVAGGPGRGRVVDVLATRDGDVVAVALIASPTAIASAGDLLAIARAVLRRDGGDLRCAGDRVVVRLPLAIDQRPLAG